MSKKTVIHWFRKGLRVHDNLALRNAIEICLEKPKEFQLRPIFVLDPGIIKWLRVGSNRWRFLQETLENLNDNLKKLNTRLYVVRGDYKTVFVRLFKEWNVDTITWEKDIEPYSVERDNFVSELANNRSIIVIVESTLNCFDTELIIQKNGGRPPLTFQKYLSVASTCAPPVPVEVTVKIPDSCHPEKDKLEVKNSHCYDPPTLAELQVDVKDLGTHKFPGGETEALARMERSLKNAKWVREFEKPNTSPNSLEPSTTVLSPYIKFGCLSARLFYVKVKEIYKTGKHAQPPVSLEGQILWREFYYCVGSATKNFDKMVGNSVCCQIPWANNAEYLEAWTYGRTGYPFIDAIMRQLRQEGWIHHLARHAVACFLTRGDLWINWEEGQKVFEELLLDADWALNAGNWMWLSASAFFHQYFRVYSPVVFGQKTDKEGLYIKKYVPELKNYPAALIYEPWKATNELQRKFGCIIGKDYPMRIVKHEEIYKVNLGKMKEAYAKNKLNKDSMDPPFKRKIEDVKKESPSPKKMKKAPVQKNLLTNYFKK